VRAGLLGYQVLYLADEHSPFQPPQSYRREALVCASTHDLPTLRGWWAGKDIDWRRKTGLATATEAERQWQERREERRLLAATLAEAGLLPSAEETSAASLSDAMIVAVHRFLGRTPCRLFAVQLDDALGAVEQANLPGTVGEHPNWRRKIAVAIEDLGDHALFRDVTEAVAAERPRS
jgi:4-alpha-glucanotransferase